MTFSIESIWPDEKIEVLKRLWATDLSMAGIAAEMGLTRNAVIGKCSRLGLPSRAQAPRLSEEELRRRRLERQRAYDDKRRISIRPKVSKKMEAPSITPPPPYVGDLRIPTRDLRDLSNKGANQCRYIADEPPGPDYLACGNETAAGESYCPHCRKLTRSNSALTQEERALHIRQGTRNHLRLVRKAA